MAGLWRGAIFGSAVAGLASAGAAVAGATGSELPKDPCALLTPAEIQAAVAAGAKVGPGVPTTSTLPLGVSCSYTWGPRTREWGESSVTVMILDGSKAWPGLSAEQIEQGVLLGHNSNGDTSSPISGVGDAALFTVTPRSHNVSADAFFAQKGEHVSVEFHGGDAGSKDKVVALLKKAAAKL